MTPGVSRRPAGRGRRGADVRHRRGAGRARRRSARCRTPRRRRRARAGCSSPRSRRPDPRPLRVAAPAPAERRHRAHTGQPARASRAPGATSETHGSRPGDPRPPSLAQGRRQACAAEALRGAHSTPFRAMYGSTVKAMTKTWLITGAGRGMGVEFARAALAAGHNVAATGRNPDTVRSAVGEHENLLVTALDVTDPHSAEDAAAAAIDRFGRIDVLLNNAGSFVAGFFEELTTDQVHAQIETNLFGPMTVTRAVLPVMRRQHSGLVISISSGAGVVGSPSGSAYAASKFALEGWMESLTGELQPFGIGTMIVEPGFFRTELLPPGSTTFGERSIDDYDEARGEVTAFWTSMNGTQAGDPAKLARALVQLADSTEPPLRWAAGEDVVGGVEDKARLLLAQVDAHRELSVSLAHEDAKAVA